MQRSAGASGQSGISVRVVLRRQASLASSSVASSAPAHNLSFSPAPALFARNLLAAAGRDDRRACRRLCATMQALHASGRAAVLQALCSQRKFVQILRDGLRRPEKPLPAGWLDLLRVMLLLDCNCDGRDCSDCSGTANSPARFESENDVFPSAAASAIAVRVIDLIVSAPKVGNDVLICLCLPDS